MSVKHTTVKEKEVNKLHSVKLELAFSSDAMEKDRLDKLLAAAIDKVNKGNLEKEIESKNNIKQRKGTTAAIFNLKESVLGEKKIMPEDVLLEDQKTRIFGRFSCFTK